MSVDDGLFSWIEEATRPLGHLSRRRLFGGGALYLDGVIFAIVARGELWLKADRQSEHVFEEAGCERFALAPRDGRQRSMNYWRAPGDVYDGEDAMLHWAALALEAGRRARRD